MNGRDPQIKKYTIHILAIRALSPDTVDLPPEQNAFIICTERRTSFIDTLDPRRVLTLPFTDTEEKRHPKAFRQIHAQMIVLFIRSLPDTVTDLYVCCAKGGSRSPAVAAALLRASGRSDMDVWRNPFYVPNTLVYQRLCREFGMKMTSAATRCRVLINDRAFRKAQKERGSAEYERWQILE